MLSTLFWALFYICGFLGTISFLAYLLVWIFDNLLFCEQNLKKKYNAEWAVVTGASSGIGRALTEKLLRQGISVVMVALADKTLDEVHALFAKDFADQEVRKVGVNLAKEGYIKEIADACSDIEPTLIFNNAGFVSTGLFWATPIERLMANYDCNATAAVKITHHFMSQMVEKKQQGCVCFTSSPAGIIPNPMTSMYGSTKAFLTEFGASVAAEVRSEGIDVLVVHPSPVDTKFYSGNHHDLGAMEFFRKTATSPERVASCFFRSVGRTVVYDQGYFPLVFKTLMKILDFNIMSIIINLTTHTNADYVKAKASAYENLRKKK